MGVKSESETVSHMNRLTIIGSVTPYTGYGKHLIRAAQDIECLTGTRVGIRALKPPHPDTPEFVLERICTPGWSDGPPNPVEWELIIAPPTVCPTPGKRTVYFTMNETTQLTEQAVALLNKAEHVIVPNQWNREVFGMSGVKRNLHVVPLGIDHRIFNWRPLPPSKPIIFGTAGSGPRKGIPDVIKAFLEAFPGRDDVRLKIKITTEDEMPDVVDPRIQISQGNFSDEGMAEWYGQLHCFVSASRGEGWGLMQQEAAAMGRGLASAFLPGMSWTGRLYSTNRLAPAPAPYAGEWYAGPDFQSFSRTLQEAAQDFSTREIYSNTNAERFTWDRSSAELIQVLTNVGAICKPTGFDTECKALPHYEKRRDLIVENFGEGGGEGDRPRLARAETVPPECASNVDDAGVARVKRLPAPTKYYHSGNLGDIIYGLYAIREHCGDQGAELIIGPCQHGTGANSLSAPITKAQYEMLLPLLKTQSWLKRVRWTDYYPIAEEVHDMNGFRKVWARRHTLGIKTLCLAQFFHLGIRHKFDESEAWMDIEPNGMNVGRVIIHRSARWRQDEEMWRTLTRSFRDRLLFVGLPEEYYDFENKFGPVSFWKVTNFLEMAQLIADNEGFVGNQSFPCALAIAMGQCVIQEQSSASPDCDFSFRIFTQKDDVKGLVNDWLNIAPKQI